MKNHQTHEPLWAMAEQLANKLLVLDALLQNTCAERSSGFATLEEDVRNEYLMYCSNLACEAQKEASHIMQIDLARVRATVGEVTV